MCWAVIGQIFCPSEEVLASETETSRARAVVASSPPAIDGVLDDEAWQTAVWFDAFVQKYPANGAPPSRKTAFAVLYDDTAIYFAIRCQVDSPDEIVTRMVRRDRDADFDVVEITLSPREDQQTGYSFVVNPSGVKLDRYWSSDTVADNGWDAVWQAETQVTDDAWTVEVAISLDQIRIPTGKKRFGLQVARWISRLKEVDVFNPVPDDKGGGISTGGKLLGVEGIEGKLPLTIIPESYLSFVTTSGGYESRQSDGLAYGGGGYAKVGLASDWVLDVAVLPDFGQVEVDEVILNLSTYETLFPEKRPFFLEGAGLFNTPIQLFYSRRLGEPPANPDLDDDQSVVEGAHLTPILGAAKLTGRNEEGLFVGAIEAVYLPTEFLVKDEATGARNLREGTPWTNAVALRGVSAVGDASTVGVLGTAVNPDGSDGAYAGGLDWKVVTKNRLYAFRGQMAGSARFDEVNGRDRSKGAAVWTQVGREGGQPIRYRASYQFYSRGFDPNDLGYVKRDDLHKYVVWMDHSNLDPPGPFKQIFTGSGIDGNWNLDGVRLYHSAWLWQSANWRRNWTTEYTAYGGISHYDDREMRGGPPLWRPAFGGGTLSLNSPPEKIFGFAAGLEMVSRAYGYTGTAWTSLALRLGRVEVALTPKIKRTVGDLGYVDTLNSGEENEIAVAARQNLTELNLALKGTLVFTRELTFQLNSQLLNVSADYHHYGAVQQNGRLSPMAYRDETGAPAEGDFATTNLVIQGLLRFEYRPGSTLYLIYIQRGLIEITSNRASISDALGNLDDGEQEQLFMLKLSHRFG